MLVFKFWYFFHIFFFWYLCYDDVWKIFLFQCLSSYVDINMLACFYIIGPVAMLYVRWKKTSSWREMPNDFLDYYRFNTKIASTRIVL